MTKAMNHSEMFSDRMRAIGGQLASVSSNMEPRARVYVPKYMKTCIFTSMSVSSLANQSCRICQMSIDSNVKTTLIRMNDHQRTPTLPLMDVVMRNMASK